ERAQRVGKLQCPRRDTPQLAARAAAADVGRVRRRPRGRAARAAHPFAALLGTGRAADAGARGAASRARGLDGAARGVSEKRREENSLAASIALGLSSTVIDEARA